MIVTAWNNGSHCRSGAGYGLKIKVNDRDIYFKKDWNYVILELESQKEPVIVNIDKLSFWGPSCRELISRQIGIWLIARGLAPWYAREPPKLIMDSINENRFRVRFPEKQMDTEENCSIRHNERLL
jgi:hypothetical protein